LNVKGSGSVHAFAIQTIHFGCLFMDIVGQFYFFLKKNVYFVIFQEDKVE